MTFTTLNSGNSLAAEAKLDRQVIYLTNVNLSHGKLVLQCVVIK